MSPLSLLPTAAAVLVPSGDPTELQNNANMATDYMLHMKRSTDLRRQWVITELGLLLHQSEVKETMSIKKAKVVHS